jgi:hypothetical protein
MKEQMMDIVIYANPLLSLCIFIAWMHCVYTNSMAYVPAYFVAGILSLLMRNYFTYGVNDQFNFGFKPITVTEMFKVLLYGGKGTKFIKPIKVVRKSDVTRTIRSASSADELDSTDEDELHQSVFEGGGGFQMDGDHMEFPFSQAGRYAKKTLAEGCVDASAMFLEDDEGEMKSQSKFKSLRKKTKKSAQMILPKANREDDEEEEEDEFGVENSLAQPNGTDGAPQDSTSSPVPSERARRRSTGLLGRTSVDYGVEEVPDKPWKRVKDPRGLPEQDAKVFVKARRTLKEDILHNKDLLHKYSMRLFDDRMFIVPESDGAAAGETMALNQAIGTNKYKSPIVAKIAEYVAPGLEGLKVGLSVWRSGFNLFTWRDPFLTSLFFFAVVVVLCVLIVFPWRLFFFAIGFGAVGPQNWFLRIAGVIPKGKKKPPNASQAEKKSKKKPPMSKKGSGQHNCFQFHNHLTTDQGIDVREEKTNKSGIVHRAVVPNSPLISRRFYDWPPNPSLSQVDPYTEK